MLLLQHLALVSVLLNHVTHALPLPLQIESDADSVVVHPRFNSIVISQAPTPYLPGAFTLSDPIQDQQSVVVYTTPDCDEDPTAMIKRGAFGFLAKTGIGLAKSGAKSGAFNFITNGASKLLKLRKRDAEDEDTEQQLVRRASLFGRKGPSVKPAPEPVYILAPSKSRQNMMIGLEASLLAATVASVVPWDRVLGLDHPSGSANHPTRPHSRSLQASHNGTGDQEEGQQLVKRGLKLAGLKNIFKKTAKVAPSKAAPAAVKGAAAAPIKKPGKWGSRLEMGSNIAMLGSMVVPAVSGLASKASGASQPAPEQHPPAALPAVVEPPIHPAPAKKPVRRDVYESDEGEQLVRRGRTARARRRAKKTAPTKQAPIKPAPVTPASVIPAAVHAVEPTAKKSGGFAEKLGVASNIAMVGSVVAPLIPSSTSKASTTPPPAEQHPPAAPPSGEKQSNPVKRAFTEDEQEQYLTRRGQVANVAGGAVTTLMLFNFGKQLMGSVASHVPVPGGPKAGGPLPIGRGFVDSSQGMILYKRQPSDENHPAQGPPVQHRKPGVMEGMSSVVTLGFGGQAVQENTMPIYHEIQRIGHKVQNGLGHFLSPRSFLIQDEDNGLASRQVADEEELQLQARSILPGALKKFSPQIMNGVGHIVTVSMLTSMASPMIDSAIKTIKGPYHPDNLHQGPFRRSLILVDDTNINSRELYPCSAFAQTVIGNQVRSSRLAKLEAEEEGGNILEKRAKFGAIVGKITKNNIFKQVVSVASLAL